MDSELWNGMFPTVLVSCKQQGQHAFLGWGVSDLKVTLPCVCVRREPAKAQLSATCTILVN